MSAIWRDRSDPLMAEVAETIGTTTDLVMAVSPRGEHIFAMATPDYPASRDIVKYVLARDADGILREIERVVEVGGLDEMEAFFNFPFPEEPWPGA